MSTSTSVLECSMNKQTVQCLVQAVQKLSLSRDIETVMFIVRTTARKISGADGATFVLRENDKCYYADEDAIGPLWKGQRFPIYSCISGWAMLHKQSVVIEDVYNDSRIPINAYRPTFVKSLAMVPIRSIDDPIGAIGAYWANQYVPTEEQVILLQSLADITAVTLENIKVYNELEERVKERTRELISCLEREKEMSAMRRHFFSMASHEFKTPLTNILTSTSLLESYNNEGKNAEKRAKHINRITTCSQHLVDMVNDFLAAEKIEQGKTDIVFEWFNVKRFMKAIIDQMESCLKKGQSLVYTHNGDSHIFQDKSILRIVLLNILSNASKYSDENKPIEISTAVHAGEMTIKVKDHGIGIPKEDQPNIFNNFFRAGNTAGIQGTGLGLHIVKSCMELLNGKVCFKSRPKHGTTFTITCSNPRLKNVVMINNASPQYVNYI
ncbi:GAF domain-containing sensor histidine kinase [Longitalea arenae]|uniref:GAF domain-containing sensor histidine kinase n=1 Tax=Longitalea arenae TaxID=2812558 RepID=UPI00196743AF|nr:GAF domain-containing sensor histidine kinase [Longitalea arenae]